jgi:hypothetical protein
MSRPPSQDEKHIPSPPKRSLAQYEADQAAGINPYGRTYDARTIKEFQARCAALGVDWNDTTEDELRALEGRK